MSTYTTEEQNKCSPSVAIVIVLDGIKYQKFVDDKQFLDGMKVHHAMAIVMASQIHDKTKDERNVVFVKRLLLDFMTADSDETRRMWSRDDSFSSKRGSSEQ